jgi:hypothetical protein
LIVYRTGQFRDWLMAGIALALLIGVPVSYVLWKVRIGEISDFHIPVRSQRLLPMLLTLACTLTALLILRLGQAPR